MTRDEARAIRLGASRGHADIAGMLGNCAASALRPGAQERVVDSDEAARLAKRAGHHATRAMQLRGDDA